MSRVSILIAADRIRVAERAVASPLLLLLANVLFSGCLSSDTDGQPCVSTTNPHAIFDVGKVNVDANSSLALTARVHNSLDELVKYRSSPSCGCITVQREVIVKPHETECVTAQLELAKEPGKFHRNIVFECTSGNGPNLELAFRGVVVPTSQLWANIETINCGEIRKPIRRSIIVRRYDGSEVRFTKMASKYAFGLLDSSSGSANGVEATILTLEADPVNLPEGSFSTTITIDTQHKLYPRITLNATGHVERESVDK